MFCNQEERRGTLSHTLGFSEAFFAPEDKKRRAGVGASGIFGMRSGYSLIGCVPTEPISVFPDKYKYASSLQKVKF